MISAISGNLTEQGGTATFTVKLMSKPSAAVNIPISVSDTSEATVSGDNATHLSFSTTNWNADHIVTLTAVDDNESDGTQSFYVNLGADNTTADSNYAGVDPQDVAAATLDDESAGFRISAISSNPVSYTHLRAHET